MKAFNDSQMKMWQRLEQLDKGAARPTHYSTFNKNQLLVAKERVDNLSQADAFFNGLNKTLMFQQLRTSSAFPKASGLSPIKEEKLKNTYLSKRASMVAIEELPRPETDLE